MARYTRLGAIVEATEIVEERRTIATKIARYEGQRGDFQVVDEFDEASIVPREKFLKQYRLCGPAPVEPDRSLRPE